MLLFTKRKYKYVYIWGYVKKNIIIFMCFCADGVRKCRYLRRYSAFFSEPKYTNVVIDGDGKQKCSYFRRCATKNAIIYVCYSADSVQKCRYLRRYSTFFSEPKYTNVVIRECGK